MNGKDRVLTALARQEPDRVPINYLANAGIDRRLKSHFTLAPDDSEGLKRVLGVDFRGIGPTYIGPKLHEDIPERGVTVDNWGIHRRWIEHETGGYWDYCDFPLREADEETVAGWPMPSPDDFDYDRIESVCREYSEYACFAGNAGIGDIVNSSGMLRGMEQTLVDLITEEPAGLLLARRRTDIKLESMRRTIEAADGGIDFLWMGEDLGTQIGPIMSLELYRKVIRPLHQEFVDLAKSFDLPVIIHTCGSSSWAYDDFIDMGIEYAESNPELEDNKNVQGQWKFFEREQHKRRRVYIKEL